VPPAGRPESRDRRSRADSPRPQLERDSGLDVSAPKHGKEDPNNDPHVGVNTWAGGTGGRERGAAAVAVTGAARRLSSGRGESVSSIQS
jgi:hypothetical protein